MFQGTLKCAVIGASGYTGVELAGMISQHPDMQLHSLYVSERSADANRLLSELYPRWSGLLDQPLIPLSQEKLYALKHQVDAIFLCTDHQVSHELVPLLCGDKATVFDLSGGYRLKDAQLYEQYYGFHHQQHALLQQAVYGLAEWHADAIRNANLVAVPGCYPTASLLALKPIAALLAPQHAPVINAVSGVSGAGRKAKLSSSFCEVSLQAYGVLGHRHQPEIASQLGSDVIFTPHLGNFKRGILATIVAKLKPGITAADVEQAYLHAYAEQPAVRLRHPSWPSIQDVAETPFCDLSWKLDETSDYLVIASAIDNLLKGAASQAMQCANLRFGCHAFPLPSSKQLG